MEQSKSLHTIIIGGSYAGLSAAMALGRSLRNVLIIDSGQPCNLQTPHSHNFITHDGTPPLTIANEARSQVLKYDTVKFYQGKAVDVLRTAHGFQVSTDKGDKFESKKLLLATGLSDQFPPIDGFKECWGISVLHCPYCHGYEVRHKTLGIMGNGDSGFEFTKMISHWTTDLTIFTNGKLSFTPEQLQKISSRKIAIVEKEIASLKHVGGQIESVVFKDGTESKITALFGRVPFTQKTDIVQKLGCELTEQGYIKIDDLHRTTCQGVYAAGDASSFARAVSIATASGTKAGISINRDLIDEWF